MLNTNVVIANPASPKGPGSAGVQAVRSTAARPKARAGPDVGQRDWPRRFRGGRLLPPPRRPLPPSGGALVRPGPPDASDLRPARALHRSVLLQAPPGGAAPRARASRAR